LNPSGLGPVVSPSISSLLFGPATLGAGMIRLELIKGGRLDDPNPDDAGPGVAGLGVGEGSTSASGTEQLLIRIWDMRYVGR
jgi:hypothetical protein